MNLPVTKKPKSILIPGVCFKDNSVVEDYYPHPNQKEYGCITSNLIRAFDLYIK